MAGEVVKTTPLSAAHLFEFQWCYPAFLPPWLKKLVEIGDRLREAVTSAVMRQPLGAGPINCASFLPYPELIVQSAFETHDDKLCVPRQLAKVLGVSLSETISYFDEFLSNWQERGVTPLEIKKDVPQTRLKDQLVDGYLSPSFELKNWENTKTLKNTKKRKTKFSIWFM